jgi:hypothetical protein
MRRSSRFLRIKFLVFFLAALPLLLGSGLAIHSSLLARSVHQMNTLDANLAPLSIVSSTGTANLDELAAALEIYSTLGLIAAIAGFIFTILLVFTLHRGRLGVYRSYFRKAQHAASEHNALLLENLRFPDEDDLGRLGFALNGIVARLREYDSLRKQELLLADAVTREVLNGHERPLAVFDDQLVLVGFSPTFSDLLAGSAKIGLKTNELFADATTLEQIIQSLHKDGNSTFEPRPSADTIIPLVCTVFSTEEGQSRRLLAQFGKASGSYE